MAAACALPLAAAASCAPAPAPPAAAPAPAPAAAARQPRVFLLFYDFESDEIGPQSAAILARLLAAWRAGGAVRLHISGHADTGHSAEESMAISRRRAWRVHDWLVDAGVPVEALVVTYHGEERLLVETADGVREPQNRRVEILFEEAVTAS